MPHRAFHCVLNTLGIRLVDKKGSRCRGAVATNGTNPSPARIPAVGIWADDQEWDPRWRCGNHSNTNNTDLFTLFLWIKDILLCIRPIVKRLAVVFVRHFLNGDMDGISRSAVSPPFRYAKFAAARQRLGSNHQSWRPWDHAGNDPGANHRDETAEPYVTESGSVTLRKRPKISQVRSLRSVTDVRGSRLRFFVRPTREGAVPGSGQLLLFCRQSGGPGLRSTTTTTDECRHSFFFAIIEIFRRHWK